MKSPIFIELLAFYGIIGSKPPSVEANLTCSLVLKSYLFASGMSRGEDKVVLRLCRLVGEEGMDKIQVPPDHPVLFDSRPFEQLTVRAEKLNCQIVRSRLDFKVTHKN